jgi:hypothetical protein
MFGAVLLTLAVQLTERIEVHAIEVSASVRDASGKIPSDLKPEDFVLLEDGKPQQIIGVTVPAEHDHESRQKVVVYIQQSLSTTAGLRAAMKSLAAKLNDFDVEVVTDYPAPHRIESLDQVLEGKEEVIQIRRKFKVMGRNATPDDATADLTNADQARVRARQESAVLRSRQDAMLDWLSRYPKAHRTLLFVSDGFDLDPSEFYGVDLHEWSSSAHQEEITRALAAQGWTIVSLATASHVRLATSFKPGTHEMVPHEVFVDVLGSAALTTINRRPLDPLSRLADATGGSVVTDASLLDLGPRVILTYQTDRADDGLPRHIEVRAVRPGVTVRAQRWAGAAEGSLPVTCAIRLGPLEKDIRNSEIEVNVDLTPIADDVASIDSGTLRFKISADSFTTTKDLDHLDFTSHLGWSTAIAIRHRTAARIVVTATETSTGAWGRCVANR